jgi:hypothetical protein
MRTVSWPTLLASALVALVVTLLIEYLAKPGLEARKDRIVENSREQRSALKSLDRATNLAGALHSSYFLAKLATITYPPEATKVLAERAHKMAADVEELLSKAFEEIDVPEWMVRDWGTTIAIVTGFPLLFNNTKTDPPEEAWEEFDKAAAHLDDFVALLTTSKWRLWRRHKLTTKIKLDRIAPREQLSKDDRPA